MKADDRFRAQKKFFRQWKKISLINTLMKNKWKIVLVTFLDVLIRCGNENESKASNPSVSLVLLSSLQKIAAFKTFVYRSINIYSSSELLRTELN